MREGLETERLQLAVAADLDRAAELLRAGQTVAFPTETVYGLGANALDAAAVERIFVAKQRPHWDPLIVHIARRDQLGQLGTVSALAGRLMDTFWPGPLTLLLPRLPAVPDSVTAGRALVGVRMPAHAGARALLERTGLPIAAPSANRFGHTSPTTAAHVLADLDGRIAAVLDGGPAEVGLESTVLGFAGDGQVVVYRPGGVTPAMLREVPGVDEVDLYVAADSSGTPAALPSPGIGMRHYAPRGRLLLVAPDPAVLERAVAFERRGGVRVGAMLPRGWQTSADASFAWGRWQQEAELAGRLFAGLRALEDADCTVIVCPVPEGTGLAAAMRDRLEKAARKS